MVRYLIFAIPLILKVYCVVHALKSQKPQWWIWVIILIPFGSFYYFFTEVLSTRGTKNAIHNINERVADKVEPSRKLKQYIAQLEYSDTTANRILLADEYLKNGIFHKAAELLHKTATGIFTDDVEILSKLSHAYYLDKNYEKAVESYKRLKSVTTIIKPSKLALEYVDSLLEISDLENVEIELLSIVNNSENIEATFKLAMFYKETSRAPEAIKYFNILIINAKQLPKGVLRSEKNWVDEAIIELDELTKS